MSVTTTQSSVQDTFRLWQSFMPIKKEIKHLIDDNLYSIQIYPSNLEIAAFAADTAFQKWAAVEVSQEAPLPDGMKTLIIPKGEYAVFVHHGTAASFPKTAQYIFGLWLPNSVYAFDYRPQFEIMGPDYLGHDHEDSQEQVWIPIKKKNPN